MAPWGRIGQVSWTVDESYLKESFMRWRYKVVREETGGIVVPNLDDLMDGAYPDPENERVLSLHSLGQQGWELVAAIPMIRGGGMTEAIYLIFKQPVEDEPIQIHEEHMAIADERLLHRKRSRTA